MHSPSRISRAVTLISCLCLIPLSAQATNAAVDDIESWTYNWQDISGSTTTSCAADPGECILSSTLGFSVLLGGKVYSSFTQTMHGYVQLKGAGDVFLAQYANSVDFILSDDNQDSVHLFAAASEYDGMDGGEFGYKKLSDRIIFYWNLENSVDGGDVDFDSANLFQIVLYKFTGQIDWNFNTALYSGSVPYDGFTGYWLGTAPTELHGARLDGITPIEGTIPAQKSFSTEATVGGPTDTDGDGIPDVSDNCPLDINPLQEDDDGDGAGDACDLDDDNDGLSDVLEIAIGTDTLIFDTDSDGLGDYFEVNFDGDDTAYTIGADLNPLATDTNGDGLSDYFSVNFDGNDLVYTPGADLDPLPPSVDTDGDGLTDYFEVNFDGDDSAYTPGADLDPLSVDTDGDGLSDYFEVNFDGDDTAYTPGADLDPLSTDTDGDSLSDYFEVNFDGIPGVYNPVTDLNPLSTDTDADGVLDGADVEPLIVNIPGDVAPLGVRDGLVNAADYLVQTQFALGLLIPSAIEIQNGDLNGSGTIDAADQLLLLKMLLP